MQHLLNLFDVNNTLFTLWDYPMSYLEFFGTIFNLMSVWLVAKKNILNWPIGILGVIFFGILFYQIQLYSDLFEQFYYLITQFYGWWLWYQYQKDKQEKGHATGFLYGTKRNNLISLAIVVVGTLVMGYYVSRIHLYFPNVFPEPASYPYLDAFTTVMSFVAQILMARKIIECWYLWIAVDIIGVGLYWIKEVKFVAVLYFIFLIIAANGLLIWRKEWQKQNLNNPLKKYSNDYRNRNRKILPLSPRT